MRNKFLMFLDFLAFLFFVGAVVVSLAALAIGLLMFSMGDVYLSLAFFIAGLLGLVASCVLAGVIIDNMEV